MTKPLIVGAGSCILQAILNQMQTVEALTANYDFHLSQVTGAGRQRVPPEELLRTSILIEEANPWQGSGTLVEEERALLPESCKRITVPTLHFNSLWPFMTEDPRNKPEPGAPYGRLPFGMNDRLALRIAQTEPDPAKRRALYDALDFGKSVNIGRSHELEIRNCFQREQGCDVRVAAFVMSQFRERRLYFTHNHPTPELMYFVLAQIYALPVMREMLKEPYDRLIVAARRWADTTGVFGGEDAPIHPYVAEYFGLKWWSPDMRYRWLREVRSFDEWMDFYLTYEPGKPEAEAPTPAPDATAIIPGGPYLTRLREMGEFSRSIMVRPATRIERPAPFTTVALPEAARHRGAFENPAERVYETAEVVAAGLAEGKLLGAEGVVVYRQQLLGDTMRLFAAGDAAPVIRGADARGLVLQPGLAERRIAGRAMCGFTGMWRDWAVWLVTSLPRIAVFRKLAEADPGLKLLVPALAEDSLQAQSLRLLGIDPARIETVGEREIVACDELLTMSALDLWRMAPLVREAALALVANTEPEGGGGRRVLLWDPAWPWTITNADEVAAVATSLGFELVPTQPRDLTARIRLMRGTAVLVGSRNTAMFDALFMPTGGTVLEIFRPEELDPTVWSAAAISGHRYGFMLGEPAGGGHAIPREALQRALEAALANERVAA
jgi:capsular polysaccharide biosynthesis protein